METKIPNTLQEARARVAIINGMLQSGDHSDRKPLISEKLHLERLLAAKALPNAQQAAPTVQSKRRPLPVDYVKIIAPCDFCGAETASGHCPNKSPDYPHY